MKLLGLLVCLSFSLASLADADWKSPTNVVSGPQKPIAATALEKDMGSILYDVRKEGTVSAKNTASIITKVINMSKPLIATNPDTMVHADGAVGMVEVDEDILYKFSSHIAQIDELTASLDKNVGLSQDELGEKQKALRDLVQLKGLLALKYAKGQQAYINAQNKLLEMYAQSLKACASQADSCAQVPGDPQGQVKKAAGDIGKIVNSAKK